MPTKLEQVMALSNSNLKGKAFQLDDMPVLEGLRPDQIQRFNDGLKEWKRKTEVRLSEQLAVPQTES